jgi:exosortase/archaeosortase family protein
MLPSATPAAPTVKAIPIVSALGVRFAVTYLLLAVVLFSIYGFPFELFGARSDWLSPYLAGYARLAGGALGLFERGISVTGTRIDGRFSLQIVRNCDAIEVNILFACAVLAFPAPLGRRVVALLGGLSWLVLANVLRICALYFLGVHFPTWFRVAHEEVLPLVLITGAALLFLGCVRYLNDGPIGRTQEA